MQSWKPSIWGKSIPRFWKHGACCWTAMAATWSDGKNSQRRQSAWTFMATCPALGASLIRRGWCHCRECKYMVSLYYVILCDVMCLIFPQLKSLKLEFTTVQWICRGHQWKHLLWFEPRAGKNTFSRVFSDPEQGIHQGELDATSFAEPGAQQKTRRPESGKRMGWLDDSTREMAFNSEIDDELWHDMMSLVNSLWSPCELWVLTILTILTILTDLRLSAFKSWADAEFGGVRAAFTVLDEDNSHDFNVREFIKMLRFYGFQGDCRALFSTLDCDGHGTLSLNEISFLDLWESPPPTPNRSKENFASRMSQMLPTKNTESETQTKKEEKMKKLPQVSPRLEELARSRHPRAPHRLPLLANASKSTLDSSVAFSSASKSRLQKSVYGSFSRTDGFLEEINKTAWRNFRVKVIKEEILSGHINEDFDFTPLDATFSKVKKKTIALRLRTIELLDKDNQDLRNCLNHSNSVDSLDP